jgi:tetratricopeptide (TPR) repeat protein
MVGVLFATVAGLSAIPTGNPTLISEQRLDQRGPNVMQRSLARAQSMTQAREYTERSFSLRLVMWKATARMIQARPLTGVGAGAWEVDIPLYQAAGAQLETDYYAHNEFLQLLAEYGLAGWVFLLALLAWLLQAAWRTLRNRTPDGRAEAPMRAVVLLSLLLLLVVSNAGFPWRMASTGALFALSLAVLAASDARLGYRGTLSTVNLAWKPMYSQGVLAALMVSTALAVFITQQAAECESKIVQAVKLALTVSQSGDYHHPRWDQTKRDMLTLMKEGTDVNPHYRKITPMVADELARWGDWRNAIWIWESVLNSRPYVVAIMSNVARGHASLGDMDKAMAYLQRARKLQPRAPSVASLEIILLSRSGREAEAYRKTRALIAGNVYDYDLVNAAYSLGVHFGDWPLAIKALTLRTKDWPALAVDGWLKIGNIYASTDVKDEAQALSAFRAALAATPDSRKAETRAQIPASYQARL